MSKLFLSSSIKFVPQMNFGVRYTENGGIETTQTFIARKSSLGTADLNLFARGTRWEQLWPEVPAMYGRLTMKTFDPQQAAQPGMIEILATFTGYQWANNGSSGTEPEVPTTSLRGQLGDVPLNEMKKWKDLSEGARGRLNLLLDGSTNFDPVSGRYIKFDTALTAIPCVGAILDSFEWVTPTGNELKFAKLIAMQKLTYRKGSWTYNYRTESKTGFTASQLNTLGKIVANPPGNPVKPNSGWTWLLIGPDQSQSGPDRFIKDLSFELIEDNADNQFLYSD